MEDSKVEQVLNETSRSPETTPGANRQSVQIQLSKDENGNYQKG
jgi:hypothetical protein